MHETMILLIDDDPGVVASLALVLKRAGHQTRPAACPAEAMEALAAEPCQLVLQDMNFSSSTSGDEGLVLLKQIQHRYPELPVILMTAWGSIELAVQGMRAGASDFITKPWSNDRLLQGVQTAIGLAHARPEDSGLLSREELDQRYDFASVIGRDPTLLRSLEIAGRVSATDASVLLTGESGTGKDVIAAAIQANSGRRQGPFVKVNLGGISSTLFESEMFGHVKGAFTDAREERQGRFALADGGTIFLDEVGDVDPGCQVKLLRVLQERTFEVLGCSRTRSVDLRVISATNRDLASLVAAGEFREDLLYRLNLISLHIPPLRQRRGDIPDLARSFVDAAALVYARPGLEIAADGLEWLAQQQWPGNVRELKQAIERTVLISSRQILDREELASAAAMQPPAAARSTDTAQGEGITFEPGATTLEEMERTAIIQCLEHCGGNLTRTADVLGLSRTALYRRLDKYGIQL
jgi:two-component system, NtrC family, response regulator